METNKILIIILVVILVVMLFRSHVTVIQPQPIKPVPIPVPVPIKPIGGCAGTRYGCCPDGRTPRINPMGTNCP